MPLPLLIGSNNPGKLSVAATLVVDALALKLPPGPAASALATSAPFTCRKDGPKVEVSFPVAAGACEVLRLGQ